MQKASAFGNYRAVVVDNVDKEQFGRVLVWIPDLMPEVDRKKGIWARPANNPLGGRNKEDNSENYYAGTSYIPEKGSWVFVFFEGGNVNRPYYFGALDLENTKVLPENQVGDQPQNKWVVLKSGSGRAIVVSDDTFDERVEITGKKRQIKTPPTGDTESVTKIDDNITTILLDERDGKQKVLIRTYKGDFLHIDIDEQNLQAYFKNDIIIKCDNDMKLTVNGQLDIKTNSGDINIESGADMNLKSTGDMNKQSGGSSNNSSQGSDKTSAGSTIDRKAGGNINDDGSQLIQQTGASSNAGSAASATEADPKGERDT